MKLSAPNFSHIGDFDRLIITKHLSVMVKAGIPVSEALSILTEQNKNKTVSRIIGKISDDVKSGKSLSEAMDKYPDSFGQFYTSLIKVSEESGTLEQNLIFLAKQMSKDYQLKKKIQGALLYPGLVLVATLAMSGFIAFFILPKLVDFFGAFDIQLPLATRILLFFANMFQNHGLAILISLVIIFFATSFITSMPKVKPYWHHFLLKVPLFGKLIFYGQLARFSRNLGVLLQSGVPIEKSLHITAQTLSNLKFQNDLILISDKASQGKSIAQVIEGSIFPSLTAKMISIGEKTGKLDETLLYLSDFYEEEIDNISKNLSTILEPALLLGVGLLVGFVALAIIGPIYELTGSIRR